MAERQKLVDDIGCHEQQVRRSIKQLRYQYGKSRTWGISSDTELLLEELSASNNDRLNPSEEEINALIEDSRAPSKEKGYLILIS
jgi:hypothetical protein